MRRRKLSSGSRNAHTGQSCGDLHNEEGGFQSQHVSWKKCKGKLLLCSFKLLIICATDRSTVGVWTWCRSSSGCRNHVTDCGAAVASNRHSSRVVMATAVNISNRRRIAEFILLCSRVDRPYDVGCNSGQRGSAVAILQALSLNADDFSRRSATPPRYLQQQNPL